MRYGAIICYNRITGLVTGQSSAYHTMVVLDLVWTTDPCNTSAVRNGRETVRTRENMGGAVKCSVAQKFDKLIFLIKFYEYSFHKSETKLSKYCHVFKCGLLLLNKAQRSMRVVFPLTTRRPLNEKGELH